MRRLSGAFRNYADVYYSTVVLQVSSSNSRTVTSEGTELAMPSATARLVMEAQTRADDGMDLLRVETFQAPAASGLPPEKELMGKIEKMAADLKALRNAPVAEPYDGPALLSGRAAAVFFHEVLGHRMEGHRQKDEEEGQTFTKKVGQQVLPTFLSVVDDPTMKEMDGIKLAGTYSYDNEGVPAQRVEVIEDGVLKNFLMSRMPIKNFDQSNGHGRNQPGLMPTGRQGNLIVYVDADGAGSGDAAEADRRSEEGRQAVRTLFRRYSGRVYADDAIVAAGVPGVAGDCLQGVRGRAAGRIGARRGHCGDAAGGADAHYHDGRQAARV